MKNFSLPIALAVILSAVCAAAIIVPGNLAAEEWHQTWKIYSSDAAGKVHFGIERSKPNHQWNASNDMSWSRFQGLSADSLSRGGAVKFEYVHDAGRLLCEGHVASGTGAGTFTFVPNPQYSAELQRLGYTGVDPDKVFDMLMMDVSLEFARGIRAEFASATTDDLVKMRIHGVTLDYIREVHQAGYRDLSVQDFVDMRIHGVSTEFIRDLKAAGYNITARQLIELRIHGVSSDYLRELKNYGLHPDASGLVQMRIHGVSPEYLKGLQDGGYGNLSVDQIVQLRIHGVSMDFVKDAKTLGYRFTASELVELRIHGVDGNYLRKLQTAGMKNLNAEQIARLKIHGVD